MNKLFLLLCWVFTVPVFGQQLFYVNTSATGLNTGLSWNDAFTQLQPALQLAGSGDEIWIAKGTYRPTSSTDRTISFEPKSGVKLYGGFAGGETLLGQRDWVVNETVLSGDIGVMGISTDNTYNVVFLAYPDQYTLLDGLIIQDGVADAPGFSNISSNRKVCGGGV